MVKRKRKAPKRKGKRKFGVKALKAAAAAAKEKVKQAGDFAGKAKTMFIKKGGAQILPLLAPLVDFKEAKKQLKDAKQKEIAGDIETNIQKDLTNKDVDFKSTVAYFKETAVQKGNDLKEAFYKILAQKKIYEKMEQQVNNAFKNIPNKAAIETGLEQLNLGVGLNYDGFLSILNKVYTNSKDVSKKLSFNILGSLLSKKPTESDYKKNLLDDAKKAAAAAEEAKKTESAPPAPEAKKTETKPATTEKPTTAPKTTTTSFGKRKRGPSASLKRMCKKHGVRLTVKRGKKRVYKSSKVLKGECQRKLKNKLKKNFGKKKIKRSGIMPPRKTRGKKRRSGTKGKKYPKTFKRLMEKMYRGTQKRGRAASRYARRNPGNVAAGLGALGALGLGGVEASRARGRYLLDREGKRMASNPYTRREDYADFQARRAALESPTGRFFRGVRDYPYGEKARGAFEGVKNYDYRGAPGRAYTGARKRAGRAYTGAKSRASSGYDYLRNLFKRKPAQAEMGDNLYGKRRRRRKSKYDFGKKASKKPSAATRRMCKRLKVKMTLKRGGKRVYKSEAMLKKQCKKAMKRKSKK